MYHMNMLTERAHEIPMTVNPDHLTERLIFPVSPAMAEEIKEYWHDQRLNSKSEAIRQLLEESLERWRKRKEKGK
jgi:metal-responsive CopG/Arc/MetJ family transcriptional regulator